MRLPAAASKFVPGITRSGAASFHFLTPSGVPKTTAVTFRRSISATTSLMYSPFAEGYSLGEHSSCTQPNGPSVLLGSEAMNFAVFGHIGTAFGGESSIACTWTSITGGTVFDVFCARDVAGNARNMTNITNIT